MAYNRFIWHVNWRDGRRTDRQVVGVTDFGSIGCNIGGSVAHGSSAGHLELDKQGQMVGRYLRIGAAEDLVLTEPIRIEGAKEPERAHELATVENIVDDSFKVAPKIAKINILKGHQRWYLFY